MKFLVGIIFLILFAPVVLCVHDFFKKYFRDFFQSLTRSPLLPAVHHCTSSVLNLDVTPLRKSSSLSRCSVTVFGQFFVFLYHREIGIALITIHLSQQTLLSVRAGTMSS